MNPFQALILGIVQGATEFIPVSSSGHLVLVPWIVNWPQPGLAFNALAHWGTLFAILVYFLRDFVKIVREWAENLLLRRPATDYSRLGWLLIVGTLPAAVIGFLGNDFFESLFSEPVWAAGFLFVTAGILTLSERIGKKERGAAEISFAEAFLIGLAQAAAIAPGISRSGATIGMALFLGLRRAEAARFSFLLSAPIIFGAGFLELVKLIRDATTPDIWLNMVMGFGTAAISGYLCIRFLLAYLRRGKLYPFAIYCVLLASISLVLIGIR